MSTSRLWSFMAPRDKKKLTKVGFATPRGGAKNAYQNHVSRANRVIVPFERLDDVDLELFEDGYVVRLLPEQCFTQSRALNPQLEARSIRVGDDAFVLYRTREAFEQAFPPLDYWSPRGLRGGEAARRRGVPDTGEYVVRFSNPALCEGLPQGIFAPEYATEDDNFLSQAFLAWMISKVRNSPYAAASFDPLREYLDARSPDLTDQGRLHREGLLGEDCALCPLCMRPLLYAELHELLDLSEAAGLANAAVQIVGATRSTAVNLFHMKPLLYARELHHKPQLVAWGHAICNTVLGQRACVPLQELRETGVELLYHHGGLWGFASDDEVMLRSEDRGVWARLVERGLPRVPLTEALGTEVIVGEEEEEAVTVELEHEG